MLGLGYDGLKHQSRGLCIDLQGEREVHTKTLVEFGWQRVKTHRELAKAIYGDTDLNHAFGLMAERKKRDFILAAPIEPYGVYFLGRAQVSLKSTLLIEPTLKVESYEAFAEYGAGWFRKSCGDEFVLGYKEGGELFVLVGMKARDRGEADEISDLFELVIRDQEDADVKTMVRELEETHELSYHVFQNGGPRVEMKLRSLSQATDTLKTYTKSVGVDNATRFSFILQSYRDLILPEGKKPMNYESIQHKLGRLFEEQLKLKGLREGNQFILRNKLQFRDEQVARAKRSLKEISAFERKLQGIQESCRNALAVCHKRKISVPDQELPLRS
ncbi:hypothetical protein [Pseudobacteriovorax antillogorgiicola]|uniref:hypothetical protein n=1 Tax=Pseudobacteriovorax antillogorgiicola TaxID=1513793 RepID=UPI00135657C6|nr:hypothetical protein [Pseudobacteriovorax antillogorgiicola]